MLKIEGRGYHVDHVDNPEPLPGENRRAGKFTGHKLQALRSVMDRSPLTISEEILWFENIPVKARRSSMHTNHEALSYRCWLAGNSAAKNLADTIYGYRGLPAEYLK